MGRTGMTGIGTGGHELAKKKRKSCEMRGGEIYCKMT